MTTSPFFLPDNTVCINFHLLQRWDLLGQLLTKNRHWCASVSSECSQSDAKAYPGTYAAAREVLGEPLRPTLSEHVDAKKFRTDMAGPFDPPHQHFGEAETLAIASIRFGAGGSRFVTDDQGAKDFAT